MVGTWLGDAVGKVGAWVGDEVGIEVGDEEACKSASWRGNSV